MQSKVTGNQEEYIKSKLKRNSRIEKKNYTKFTSKILFG